MVTFADHYVRWVADSPELTPSLNALFLAREKAMENEEKEDAADLQAAGYPAFF